MFSYIKNVRHRLTQNVVRVLPTGAKCMRCKGRELLKDVSVSAAFKLYEMYFVHFQVIRRAVNSTH